MSKTCLASRTVQTHRVFPFDTNGYGSLFGGRLTSWIDENASIAVSKFTRSHPATASIDSMSFLAPLVEGDAVTLESYVSGCGTHSVEVFTKIIGEHLLTGQKYLAATTFWTFVVRKDDNNQRVVIEAVIPESDEEKMICAGYDTRRLARLQARAQHQALAESLHI